MRRVDLDGYELLITNNLADAINAIVPYARTNNLMLWADMICINQEDLEERSQQVQLMNTIYCSAQNVAVWLGPSDSDSNLAYDWIKRSTEVRDRYLREPLTNSLMDRQRKALFTPDNRDAVQAFANLLDRPWWKRAWIVQEGTTPDSGRTLLFCGDRVLDWTHFRYAMEAIVAREENGYILGVWFDVTGNRFILDILRESREEIHDNNLSLLYVLGFMQEYECSDPRDRVYAARGMARNISENEIVPDYTKSRLRVCLDVIEHAIRCTAEPDRCDYGDSPLLFLNDVFTLPESELTIQDKPTWVPDWTAFLSGGFCVPFASWQYTKDENGLNTKDTHKRYSVWGDMYPSFYYSIEGNKLNLKGSFVDTINWSSSVFPFNKGELALSLLRSWKPTKTDLYHNGETHLEAFNRTVTTNRGCIDNASDYYVRKSVIDWGLLDDAPMDLKEREWWDREIIMAEISRTCVGRQFFYTADGFMGIGPEGAQIDDQVWGLVGGNILYVVRKLEDGFYKFVGECYVHGMMHGEIGERESFEIQDITLV